MQSYLPGTQFQNNPAGPVTLSIYMSYASKLLCSAP